MYVVNTAGGNGLQMSWKRESQPFNITNVKELWLWFQGNHKKSDSKAIMFLDDILLRKGKCPGN